LHGIMAPQFIGTTAHGKYYRNKNTFRLLIFINNSEFLLPINNRKIFRTELIVTIYPAAKTAAA
ncbi:MAG TPA: hypothetical protein DC017_00245, partial [Candidatus Wallbacteria bacterium]|nr:hypothetical protein [Candidatus Wallbacteria bacterium]